ncbi:MAG TPA: hypothetical protein VNK04_11605 [Gemmataceae bacterium]|nr:hypothetical protein [Gemmataceae bacterium]
MPEIITCPFCRGPMRVADHLLGKRVKCPGCGGTFRAGGSTGEVVEEEGREIYAMVATAEDEPKGDDDIRRRWEELVHRLRWSSRGLLLVVMGSGLYMVGLGLTFLLNCAAIVIERFNPNFYLAAAFPGLCGWILATAGLALCLGGPERYYSRLLAGAALAVGGLHLIMMLIAAVQEPAAAPAGAPPIVQWWHLTSDLPYLISSLNRGQPVLTPERRVPPVTEGMPLAAGVLELATLTLTLLYARSVALTVKDRARAGNALYLIFILPGVVFGLLLLNNLFYNLYREAGSFAMMTGIGLLAQSILYVVLLAALILYLVVLNNIRRSIER